MVRIAEINGIDGVQDLAKSLGYKSAEKLYRLNRSGNNPSFEILVDLTNKFENMNVRWLITGEGEPLMSGAVTMVTEQTPPYGLERRVDELERRVTVLEQKL